MIVGIAGKMQVGKDTVGKMWQFLSDEYAILNGLTFQQWLAEYEDIPATCSRTASKWEIKKFAGKVKEVASILTGISLKDLENDNFKNSPLPKCWNTIISEDDEITLTAVMTVRELFQKIGTDAIRNNVHPDAWVNALMADYKLINLYSKHEARAISTSFPNWIITDVRFPNEVKAIKNKKGILIRVERATFPKSNHLSETALDFYKDWDYVIDNNSSFEELLLKVKQIYNEIVTK